MTILLNINFITKLLGCTVHMESAGKRTGSKGGKTEKNRDNDGDDKRDDTKGKHKMDDSDNEQEYSNKRPRYENSDSDSNGGEGPSRAQPNSESGSSPLSDVPSDLPSGSELESSASSSSESDSDSESEAEPQSNEIPWPEQIRDVANPFTHRPQHIPDFTIPSPTTHTTPSLTDGGQTPPEDNIPEGIGLPEGDNHDWLMDD